VEAPPQHPPKSGGWIGCAVAIVILIVVLVIAIPGLLSSSRSSNDRNASTSLKTLSTAEADFRANDRDWNHVNDYWTGDVKGLYTMTSAAMQGAAATTTTDPAIKLIELSVAAADADAGLVPAGGENAPFNMFADPSPKAGYWYAALTLDLSATVQEEVTYRQDTGGNPPMGKCHNRTKFGFLAFPDGPKAGPWNFIINEDNTLYRNPNTFPVKTGNSIPPGLNGIHPDYRNWPDLKRTKMSWDKHF